MNKSRINSYTRLASQLGVGNSTLHNMVNPAVLESVIITLILTDINIKNCNFELSFTIYFTKKIT